MFKHFEGARLGLFVFVGTVLIVLSIFLIGNKEKLFVQTIEIKTYFQTIEGLRKGAPVWLSGYNIGSVRDISLAADTTGRVEVKMNIDNDVRQFIRLDSEASIETEGLVGKKIIKITPGSHDKEVIADGGIIKSKDPINVMEIVEDSRSVIKNLDDISREFSEIVLKVNQGEGTVGKLVNDDELYSSTVSIIQTADTSLYAVNKWFGQIIDFTDTLNLGIKNIAANIDHAITDIRFLIDDFRHGEGVIGKFMSDPSTYDSVMTVVDNLIKTTEATKEGALKLSENMEALKHNWLFKAYFEERGYWDAAEFDNEINQKLEGLNKKSEEIDAKLKELDKLKSEIESRK
ncbi:MAG: MlaD family protein [Melioribacteraceae bacterium]|nr:MlaD family protein [Melioribacteraceae bacterium]